MSTRHELPYTLAANPRLDNWVVFRPDGSVAIRTGKVELGQGIVTAVAQIAAEELEVDLARIRMLAVDTRSSPNEGSTTGSRSIQEGGMAMRQVCAEIRADLLAQAAAQWEVAVERLAVRDGTICHPDGRTLDYWQLASRLDWSRHADGRAEPKPASALTVVGTSVPRLDALHKLGGGGFIHDLELPGMLHGRVVRPPSYRARLLALDEAAVAAQPGVVAVVRQGRFVGVIAEREEQAIWAMQRLARACSWQEACDLPDMQAMPDFLAAQEAELETLSDTPEAQPALGPAVTANYSRPYLAHGAIGPSCGLAWWREDTLEVWSHTQSLFALRDEIADILGMARESVVAHHADGSGCYGHNGADDVALDAALLAAAVKGRPVRVQWMREDEFRWEPFGPAMAVRIEARLGADACIAEWRQHIRGNRHISRPGRMKAPGLLAARDLGWDEPVAVDMPLSMGGGSQRNAVPYYALPGMRVTNHAVRAMPLRTSALRALGAHLNVFAIESCMDELAHAAGVDPVEFRLRHLTDPRGRAVIEAAAQAASAAPGMPSEACRGRGIAFARYKNISTYAAVVVEVELEEAVRVRRVWAAVDCGRVINPDGVLNQCEGGVIQAVSWTLKEQVSFDAARITSTNWDTYPILRFSEVPEVDVQILDRPQEPSLGVGEGLTGPVAAAIGNAIFNALGVRARTMPITYESIVAAMG